MHLFREAQAGQIYAPGSPPANGEVISIFAPSDVTGVSREESAMDRQAEYELVQPQFLQGDRGSLPRRGRAPPGKGMARESQG